MLIPMLMQDADAFQRLLLKTFIFKRAKANTFAQKWETLNIKISDYS